VTGLGSSRVIDRFQGDYRWLSNFEPVDVVFEGELYPSVEHAYVAAKTLDRELRKYIAGLPTPGAAKRAGRALKLRPDWEMVKLTIMEDLIRAKFQHVRLRRLLMSTVGMDIVEGNTWGDRFWGVCGGEGENHLGRLIMKIRGEWMEGEGQ
jgi:ribA/ribD-fused uncharacterized protein